jgi:putative Holliday junction resolvase
MRIAALDVGDARIGVAISDELGLTTRGIGVVRRVGGIRDLDAVSRLLTPHAPERLVVGLPLNMDGSEGAQAGKVRRFVERLREHLGLPIDLWDERLTTEEAHQILRDAGVRHTGRRSADKGLIDQVAATVILRSYLAGHR